MNVKHPLLLICSAQFCSAMGMNLVDPLLPLYAASFKISYAMVGLVLSSFGLTRLFIEIPGGILTDRFGRKPIILLGYVLSAVSPLIAGFAQTVLELIVSRMIIGIGSALLLTASLTYVGEIAPSGAGSRYMPSYRARSPYPASSVPRWEG